MRKKLIVTVRPDGSIEVEATGYRSKSCEAATAFLEEALGSRTHQVKKPDWHQPAKREQQQRRPT